MEHIKNILFIDIETASCVPQFDLLTEGLQEQWNKKAKNIKSLNGENIDSSALFKEKAGIFSEFSKVVCIGIGCYIEENGAWKFALKSLVDDDEKILLNKFCEVLKKFSDSHREIKFCGHNIKEFDVPFLCRRMIINEIPLPKSMELHGKKPWEIPHLDTLELWRFGDYKHYTSLALLAEIFGIPSPKDDIDGSMVSEVYWKEKNLERIATYCLKDVFTTAKIFLRLKGIKDIHAEAVYY